jgi:transcriptional regulator with XRE-family HTH domain
MLVIGEAIKKARLEKGYSRERLSLKAHVSHQNIFKWESGKAYPNIINLIPIADALNVSLDELVGRRCER